MKFQQEVKLGFDFTNLLSFSGNFRFQAKESLFGILNNSIARTEAYPELLSAMVWPFINNTLRVPIAEIRDTVFHNIRRLKEQT